MVTNYSTEDTTDYPSPSGGGGGAAIFECFLQRGGGGDFLTLALQENYIPPHTEKMIRPLCQIAPETI